MKKEIERLEKEYAEVLQGHEIILQMEKSDPYDNRSPRTYRMYVVLNNGSTTICAYGFCRNKERIIEKFENQLRERL